jgi:NADPH:quinone reductase-like Zn-dependent oxidoreductase
MKAFALKRYSKSNGVDEVDVAVPQLRDGDVLVQVCAASINPLDLKIRNGELKSLLPYKLPLILGNDLAGVVVQTGPNVLLSIESSRSSRRWMHLPTSETVAPKAKWS